MILQGYLERLLRYFREQQSQHDAAWDRWCTEATAQDALVDQIRAAPASTIAGIGVKLAAMHFQYEQTDVEGCVAAALADINRLVGSDIRTPMSADYDDADAGRFA